MELEEVLKVMFDKYCETGLYILERKSLDHLMEYLKRFPSLETLNESPFE